jgi:RNA polymerase sigma factor (sigma-70 family)
MDKKQHTELTSPLSDEEKNELVLKSKNIVYYMARKFSFFDRDFEELVGWAYLGLAYAIDDYDQQSDVSFANLAFSKIKSVYYGHYKRQDTHKNPMSLQATIFKSTKGSELSLEGLVADKTSLFLEDKDIELIVKKAVSQMDETSQSIILDFYFRGYETDEIKRKYNASPAALRKITRRGKSLIKRWLSNNDLVSDSLTEGINSEAKKVPSSYNIKTDDLRKIKYLRHQFSFLSIKDISSITDIPMFNVSMLYDNPTSDYLLCGPDDSIHEKATSYCKEKYPEKLPGEVRKIAM